MSAFNWGVIGPGKIARDFARDLNLIKSYPHKITAVLSHDLKGAHEFAREFNIHNYYDDPEQFINTQGLDAVYVASPHSFHHEHTLLCLNNSIPVLCEKPLAINSEQVKEMVNASIANNTFLMEGMWIRFLPSIMRVINLVQQDVIGNLISVRANMSYVAPQDEENRFFNPELGGGSLLDLGIYPIYLSFLLMGKPEKIKAFGKLSRKGVDEACAILFHYPGGEYAVLESSLVEQTDLTATIYGDKGFIKVLKPWNERPAAIQLQLYDKGAVEYLCKWEGRGLHFEAEEVFRCIRDGQIYSSSFCHNTSLDLIGIMDEVRKQIHVRYESEVIG